MLITLKNVVGVKKLFSKRIMVLSVEFWKNEINHKCSTIFLDRRRKSMYHRVKYLTDIARELFLEIQPILDDQRIARIPTIPFYFWISCAIDLWLFASFNFNAHRSFQISIDKDRDCSLSQSSVSRHMLQFCLETDRECSSIEECIYSVSSLFLWNEYAVNS